MKSLNPRKIIVVLSIAAGVCACTMFAIAMVTGASQEQFEINRTVGTYTRDLVNLQNPLRLTFTVDLIFICVFTTLFAVLIQTLKSEDRIRNVIANVALGAMLITGFLDFYEDLHILTMLHSAVNGIAIEQSEIASQMLYSMIKFHASYLALFMIAFLLPGKTIAERVLKYSLWFFQLPVGILVYTTPDSYQLFFGVARFAFMASGFFLLAFVFSQTQTDID